MSRTDWPRSRKYSATVTAVFGASRRIIGLSSPVETIAIADSRLAPSVSSRNSRTSRPRSPTRAITTTSKSGAFASIARSDDFPTPEPAKIPILCPAQSGVKRSTTRIPVLTGVLTRARFSAGGGSASSGIGRSPAVSGPRSSMARPRASTTRPFQLSCGQSARLSARYARAPIAVSQRESNGFSVIAPSSIRTTSPICSLSPTSTFTHSPRRTNRESPATR